MADKKVFEDYCPCRDKQTWQCFGGTYFKLKPGPGKKIICPGDCMARREWEARQRDRKVRGLDYIKFEEE